MNAAIIFFLALPAVAVVVIPVVFGISIYLRLKEHQQ